MGRDHNHECEECGAYVGGFNDPDEIGHVDGCSRPLVREYPYEEGDAVVIGPECFAASDGSVLCWRGENYVRQIVPSMTMLRDPASALDEIVRAVEAWENGDSLSRPSLFNTSIQHSDDFLEYIAMVARSCDPLERET